MTLRRKMLRHQRPPSSACTWMMWHSVYLHKRMPRFQCFVLHLFILQNSNDFNFEGQIQTKKSILMEKSQEFGWFSWSNLTNFQWYPPVPQPPWRSRNRCRSRRPLHLRETVPWLEMLIWWISATNMGINHDTMINPYIYNISMYIYNYLYIYNIDIILLLLYYY